jgi:hypothetical protein
MHLLILSKFLTNTHHRWQLMKWSVPFVMKVTLGLMFRERHFKGYSDTLSSHVCFAVVGN